MILCRVKAPDWCGINTEIAHQFEKNGFWKGWEYFYINGPTITEEQKQHLEQMGAEVEVST